MSARFSGPAIVLLSLFGLAGCGGGHSPSIDVLGSYFPAWLVCLLVAIGLTILTRQILAAGKLTRELFPGPIIYPCLIIAFAIAFWLLFYRN